MSGIAGFCNHQAEYDKDTGKWTCVLNNMNHVQQRRGPDENGIFLSKHCGMAQVGIAGINISGSRQPVTGKMQGKTCTLVCDGEIYNKQELKEDLKVRGAAFASGSDAEVILQSYLRYGEDFVTRLNGVFAIALWDACKEKLFLFRDRAGVKPLFYMKREDTIVYSSEIKGILAYPEMEPAVNAEGLCEIFALGPARTYGKGVFKDILEVLPGHYLSLGQGILKDQCYWNLESHPHEDSFEDTVEKTAWLLEDAVKKQMISDFPISTFLSGGVDSSLVTSICARELKKEGKVLDTFSFDFEGNQKYFRANDFQPSQDRPWVEKMVKYSQTNHRFLECKNTELLEYLYKAVDARDLPGMADVESSMLYFCSKVADYNKVALTGECADEIFGGYPWFRKREAFETQAFPWAPDMKVRQTLLLEECIHTLPMKEYAAAAYEQTIQETPVLEGESEEEKRRREISYLNLKWFMATLLDRMDRTGMYSGLTARVPMADYRIIEYVWNVPWSMKCKDGVVKGLLRHAGTENLPTEILWRKRARIRKRIIRNMKKCWVNSCWK